jgi:hypothetical protein
MTQQERIGQALHDFVPKGDDGSPQQEGRMTLNLLLQAMCAKNPKYADTPTSVKECVDKTQAWLARDHPDFVFEHDPGLLHVDLLGEQHANV